MNENNINKLYSDFPNLYRQHKNSGEDISTSLLFDCKDGWFDIIYDLSNKLSLCDLDNGIEAIVVKQKMGLLSYKVNVDNEKIEKIIELTEGLSKTICESCGKNNSVMNICAGRQMMVLCKSCATKGYFGFPCMKYISNK